MGLFRITVEANGGSGCQRNIRNGEKVYGCGLRRCVDCELRAFVQWLQQSGYSVKTAQIAHWPDLPDRTVTDNLLTRVRSGQF